jgi:hypothetical protein
MRLPARMIDVIRSDGWFEGAALPSCRPGRREDARTCPRERRSSARRGAAGGSRSSREVIFRRGRVELPAMKIPAVLLHSKVQSLVVPVTDAHRFAESVYTVLIRCGGAAAGGFFTRGFRHLPGGIDVSSRESGARMTVVADPQTQFLRTRRYVDLRWLQAVVDSVRVEIDLFVLDPVDQSFGPVHEVKIRQTASGQRCRKSHSDVTPRRFRWRESGGPYEEIALPGSSDPSHPAAARATEHGDRLSEPSPPRAPHAGHAGPGRE